MPATTPRRNTYHGHAGDLAVLITITILVLIALTFIIWPAGGCV